MLGKNDERFVAQLDARLRAAIMLPTSPGERGALVVIVRLAAVQSSNARQQATFAHFEKTVGRKFKDHVIALHRAFNIVRDELAEKQQDEWPTREVIMRRQAERKNVETVDGEPAV